MLAEAARWSFPFDGVPLATLAMTQADGPLAVAARIGGALGVVGLVGISGVALSAAAVRAWRPAAVAVASVAGVIVLASVAPSGTTIDTLEVAAVQGGGPQRTRATATDASEVLARHVEATEALTDTVDVVVWPENVVSVSGALDGSVPDGVLRTLASDLGVPVVAGITERVGDTEFLNASVVYLPDGTVGDRYDKVLRVPFGEYVPLRPLMERLAPDAGLPRRDARAGTTPAVVALPEATLGVAISWEVFFSSRARDGATNGGEVLINPTNGSSYWLTQVQSQQVASSQLRALETGRWVVQAAPTGFSAIVDPGGTVVARTDVGEQAVIVANVQRRTGATWATRFGAAPLVAAAAAVAGGWLLDRRRRTLTPQRAPSPDRH
jgi:apolipoprotein N-acyltransferase